MLAYVCLLAFIGLGSCSEIEKVMPSRYEIESSINRTIEEVEKMVQDNPSLPKLSRDDIVNILYNITSTDILSMEDEALRAIQKTRQDYQRALMVVLPYKPKDSEDSLTELYTKPPMVQIVADEASDPKRDSNIEFAYNPSPYSINNAQQSENLIENKHQLVTAHMRFEDEKPKTSTNVDVKNFEVITTTKTVSNSKSESETPNSNFKDFETIKTTKGFSSAKVGSEPQKFTFNLEALDQRAEASHSSIATKRPIYKGSFSRYRTSTITPPKLEILYNTTPKTTTTTTTKTTEAEVEITTEPVKPKENILSSDQWRYYAPPTTTTPKMIQSDDSPWKPMSPSKGYFLPTIQSSSVNSEEADFTVIKMEDFQKVMETTTTTTARPAPIFVTPSIMTNHKGNHKEVQSGIKTIPVEFKLTTTTTILPTPMREEVAELLKSIGLQPMNVKNQESDVKFNQNNVDAQLNAYIDSQIQSSKFEATKPNSPSTETKQNSFKAPQLPIKNGIMNLSPDIQLLFRQFNMQVPGQEAIPVTTTTTTTTPRPTIPMNVNSYTHFKPLPTSAVKDKDFRDFLARFGLGVRDNRNQKALQMQPRQITKRPSLIDAVPNNMRKILENIGLIRKAPKVEPEPQREPEIQTEASIIVERTTQMNEHIFKPHEIVVDDKEQNEKIKNLLNTVKKVQEGRADVQDVQKVAHELLQSTKSLANGPDPLKLEEILNNYRDNLKNEVKRQEEQTTTLAPATAATPTTEELDEATLSSMATTDSSGSFSELSESSTMKTDQSSSSSSKPSFFDTLDISAFLNQTDTSSTTATPSSGSTQKPNFFDTIDLSPFLNNATTIDESGKNSNVNLTDLEASFGGSTAEPDPVLPTRPKTGLYFLVDWNTFLEVGEDGKEKVNLRFAPKVGDRSRFIPVKIP